MTSEPNHKFQRRFPRIFLQKSNRPLSLILGAKCVWPTGDRLDVHDLSYVGAAFVRTQRTEPRVGEKLDLVMELVGLPPFEIPVEVARLTDKLIAVAFGPLTTEARQTLESFLHEKMIGVQVRGIDPKYFAKPGNFTHWFHGPNNTNIFLWYEEMKLKQATVEFGPDLLNFKGGVFTEADAEQYVDFEQDDYVKPVLERSQIKQTPAGFTALMGRILNMLSQVDDPERVLEPLLQAILERKK